MLQKRKLEGCLCRVPNRFYNQVWDILRRTPRGIRFRNQVLPQQPTINNMTHSELQFALYIESMLNQLEKPEYRQLIVEVIILIILIIHLYLNYNRYSIFISSTYVLLNIPIKSYNIVCFLYTLNIIYNI